MQLTIKSTTTAPIKKEVGAPVIEPPTKEPETLPAAPLRLPDPETVPRRASPDLLPGSVPALPENAPEYETPRRGCS